MQWRHRLQLTLTVVDYCAMASIIRKTRAENNLKDTLIREYKEEVKKPLMPIMVGSNHSFKLIVVTAKYLTK